MMKRRRKTKKSPGEDEMRVFRLSVDVRSFRAGARLPMKAVNAFVKVRLPQAVVKLAMAVPSHGSCAKSTAPLRTHPPVMVQKGSEVSISNGLGCADLWLVRYCFQLRCSGVASFSARLAAALAQNPRLQAQVFHRDKYAADSLIGSASIPMAPLINEPWFDSYASVFSSPTNTEQLGQVVVGALRVVLSAEELGPVSGSNMRNRISAEGGSGGHPCSVPVATLEDSFLLLKKQYLSNLGLKAVGVQTESHSLYFEEPRGILSTKKSGKADILHGAEHRRMKPTKSDYQTSLQNQDIDSGTGKSQSTLQQENDIRNRPEYELTWEFEMWRRSEEAKWQGDLKERETKRKAILETEWKQREKERTAELDKTRAELMNLENKIRTKLFELEKRERALVLAEEVASMRREALNKDFAQRASDAEVAIKRLQVECEHRVELEQTRYASLKEQHTSLEKHLVTANESLSNLEKQFVAYKTQHHRTSEADLTGQVILLKQQCSDFQARTELALRARNQYKVQVLQMAKELSDLHHKSQEKMSHHSQDHAHLALSSLVETQARRTMEERFELQRLKEQLEQLQMQEETAMSAAAAAVAATSAVSRQQVPQLLNDTRVGDLFAAPAPCCTSETTNGRKKGKEEGTQANLDMLPNLRKGLAKVERALFSRRGDEGGRDELEDWLTGKGARDDGVSSFNMTRIPLAEMDHHDVQDDASSSKMTRNPLTEMGEKCHETVVAPVLVNFPQMASKGAVDEMKKESSFNCEDDRGENEKAKTPFNDNYHKSFCSMQLSAFQRSEIERLQKQKADLLKTGAYTQNDRIIKGLEHEIERLQSVDTNKFNL